MLINSASLELQGDVGGVFGAVKTHRNMVLLRQIVDLVRLDFLDDADQVAGIGEIAVMEAETEVFCVWILIEVIDALRIEGAGPAFYVMNKIPLFKEKFCQIGTILAGNAGDEGNFGGILHDLHILSF